MTAATTLHDRTEDILYWDESGQVACDEHKPYRGSDTWRTGRWSVFSSRDRDDFAKMTGRETRCEICR